MLSGRSKSKDLDAVAGDGDPVTLLSMAKRRAPTPGAQWSARVEMQSDEKIAVYNRQKPPVEHLKVIDVSYTIFTLLLSHYNSAVHVAS